MEGRDHKTLRRIDTFADQFLRVVFGVS
jgi:hypothetical protein